MRKLLFILLLFSSCGLVIDKYAYRAKITQGNRMSVEDWISDKPCEPAMIVIETSKNLTIGDTIGYKGLIVVIEGKFKRFQP